MLNVSLHHNPRIVSGLSIGRIIKKHNNIFGFNRLLKKKKKQRKKNQKEKRKKNKNKKKQIKKRKKKEKRHQLKKNNKTNNTTKNKLKFKISISFDCFAVPEGKKVVNNSIRK